jgi:AraC-like DNA-binding protein
VPDVRALRAINYSRHSSELGRFESVVAAPHPALRDYVREYVGGSEEPFSQLRRRELPTEIAPVIISFGAPFQLFDNDSRATFVEMRSFATGAFDTYALVGTTGPYACVQINFTILGARLFLQQPLHALANREVALDDVLGNFGRRLEMELYEAPGWGERFDILDRVILARVANTRVPAAVVFGWEQLVRHAGHIGIAALVKQSGWSHKHFVAQFTEHIGLTPKAMARVLRFGRAAQLLQITAPGRFADIAYACGYYDQAHFTRDFSAFAGVSPTELLASQMPNRGGFVVS